MMLARSPQRERKTPAERAKRARANRDLRAEITPALILTGRLSSADQYNREAIKNAVDILCSDWAHSVTCDGHDFIPRAGRIKHES
jgi:hypothetical protein